MANTPYSNIYSPFFLWSAIFQAWLPEIGSIMRTTFKGEKGATRARADSPHPSPQAILARDPQLISRFSTEYEYSTSHLQRPSADIELLAMYILYFNPLIAGQGEGAGQLPRTSRKLNYATDSIAPDLSRGATKE